MNVNKPGTPFLILFGAVVLLGGLSLIPWGEITDHHFKNFNLIADLCPGQNNDDTNVQEMVDPALAEFMGNEDSGSTGTAQGNGLFIDKSEDGVSLYELASPKAKVNNKADDGTVIIEDYTVDGQGLKNFRNALSSVGARPVRIAVIGDSYIEGDILTMDLRESLQNRYGGAGVGYVPASSPHAAFRTSVRQEFNGWRQVEIRKKMSDDMKTLPGEYFIAQGPAKSNYKGVTTKAHLDRWNQTSVMALSPNGGQVTLSTDSATRTLQVPPGSTVEFMTISEPTTSAHLTATSGVEILGVYLNNSTGISVDNMSIRGNSGVTHRSLSVDRARETRPFVDYDLIIVEFGINVLTSNNSKYGFYQKAMKEVISRLKDCYPNADILLMGIGDRGQKLGGQFKSVPTSSHMTEAQRDAARETGILFWDARAAMGGDGAALRWRDQGLINPDYIHLNYKGGKALSDLMFNAIIHNLDRK